MNVMYEPTYRILEFVGVNLFAYLSTLNLINSVMSIVALIILHRRYRWNPSYFGMMFWFLHVAIYWNTILLARIFLHYTGPSVWVSTWASAVFLHATLGIVGDRIARKASKR